MTSVCVESTTGSEVNVDVQVFVVATVSVAVQNEAEVSVQVPALEAVGKAMPPHAIIR